MCRVSKLVLSVRVEAVSVRRVWQLPPGGMYEPKVIKIFKSCGLPNYQRLLPYKILVSKLTLIV